MKRAIFYLTYNGVYNNTNGIGTQTKIFLKGIHEHKKRLEDEFGKFDVHIIAPAFDSSVFGFDEKILNNTRDICRQLGGNLHLCNSIIDAPGKNFWSVDNWKSISISASSLILQASVRYEEVLVICVDPPFLHVPLEIERNKQNFNKNIKSLITLYTSSFIHDKNAIKVEKLEWEYSGVSGTKLFTEVKMAKVCDFMKNHYIDEYGCHEESFVTYDSSLLLSDEDFVKLNEDAIEKIIKKYNIPKNEKIILAFGRAAWIKGFDVLLESMKSVKSKVHLVLIVVPFDGEKDITANEYLDFIKTNNINCTFLQGYNRELPLALSQWKNTKAVVCPSRGEPFSNIPLEVGLWAKDQGAVVIASDIDGFTEQITDGLNGFLFKSDNPKDLSQKIEKCQDPIF